MLCAMAPMGGFSLDIFTLISIIVGKLWNRRLAIRSATCSKSLDVIFISSFRQEYMSA